MDNIMHRPTIEQAKPTVRIRQAVKEYMLKNGGYAETAARIGVSAHTLWNQMNRSDSMQIDMAVKLNKLIPGILDIINDACGYVAIPKERVGMKDADFKEIERLIAIKEARLLTEIEKDISPRSLGGSRLVNTERRRIWLEALNLVREVRALMLLVKE